MFDIGFWEISLILVLALIIIGPERLPGAAKKAGYWVGRARRYVEGVRNEVESQVDLGEFKRLLHNQEVQINELQQQLNIKTTKLTDAGSEMVGSDITDNILTDVSAQDSSGDDASAYEITDEWEEEEVTTVDNNAAEQLKRQNLHWHPPSRQLRTKVNRHHDESVR